MSTAFIVETALLGFMLFWCFAFAVYGVFWRRECRFYRQMYREVSDSTAAALELATDALHWADHERGVLKRAEEMTR